MLTDFSVRKRWDKRYPVMEILEKHSNHVIMYWYVHTPALAVNSVCYIVYDYSQIKMPPGVTDRDAVHAVTKRWDEAEGAWFIISKSTEHKSKPPTSELVRCVHMCVYVCMCVCVCVHVGVCINIYTHLCMRSCM